MSDEGVIPDALLELLRAEVPALREQGVELLRLHLGDAEAVAALLAHELLAPDTHLTGALLVGVRLAGLDLSRVDLSGADLRGADLQKTDLRAARLCGALLRGADLRQASLSRADLSGADLSQADLRGADLHQACLTDARLQGGLCTPSTRLPGPVEGVHWLRPCARLEGIDLHGLDLSGLDLRGADLRQANLSGAELREVCLRGADLRQANLSGAVLRGALLVYSDLRGADLRDADLVGVDLGCAALEGARLEGATLPARAPPAPLQRARPPSAPALPIQVVGLQAPRLDLRELVLRRAQLPEADLRGADLRCAELEDVDLSGADLRGAVLAGATLRRVQLGGARLEGADLRWMTVEESVLPRGPAVGEAPRVAACLPAVFPRAAAEAALRLRSPGSLWGLCGQLRASEPYRELLASSAAWMEASGPPATPIRIPDWLSRRASALAIHALHQRRREQVAAQREGSIDWVDVGVRQALERVWEEVFPPVGALHWVATGGSRWTLAHPISLLEGGGPAPRFLDHAEEGSAVGLRARVVARCWVWGGFWNGLDITARVSAMNQDALLSSPQAAVLESLRLPGPTALYPLVRAKGTALPNLRALTLLIREPGTHIIPDLSAATPNLEQLEILRVQGEPGGRGQTRIALPRMHLPRLHHLVVRPHHAHRQEPPPHPPYPGGRGRFSGVAGG